MRVAQAFAMLWLATGCYADHPLDGNFRCDLDDPNSLCPHGKRCSTGICCTPEDTSDACVGFVRIGPGPFMRGCDPKEAANCPEDAQPAGAISLKSFALQSNEVTQGAYDRCVQSGTCTAPAVPAEWYSPSTAPELPVRGLTKHNAETYCQSIGARLPSEAEWERAAREVLPYPWGGAVPNCSLANFAGCGHAPQPSVATRGTPSGIHDLAGNVREWVRDGYDPGFYARAPDHDPLAPAETGRDSVVRGGGFASAPEELLVWVRDHANPAADPMMELDDVGVRCARGHD